MRKIVIILSVFALSISSCRQAIENQAEMANSKVAIEQDNEIVIKDNNQGKIIDDFVYYKERVIISWIHNDEDLEEYRSKYTEEEWDIVIDDEMYYSGTAYQYFEDKGEKVVVTRANSIGFIYQQDTVIISKKDVLEDEWGFWDMIILFDGKRKPVITAPIDVHCDNDEYSWFFKK